MKKKLKDNTIYLGDNGAAICHKCAGKTALYTGRDTSGQRVFELSVKEGQSAGITSCESGCTNY